MKEKYPEIEIGYSDHSTDELACIGAVYLGATIIERHITLRRDIPNAQDWKVSSMPNELKKLRVNIDRAAVQIGKKGKTITQSAMANIEWACKSPYYNDNYKKGTLLKEDMFKMKRPYTGMNYETIIKYIGEYKLERNVMENDEVIIN